MPFMNGRWVGSNPLMVSAYKLAIGPVHGRQGTMTNQLQGNALKTGIEPATQSSTTVLE